jgi:hypothetical protein
MRYGLTLVRSLKMFTAATAACFSGMAQNPSEGRRPPNADFKQYLAPKRVTNGQLLERAREFRYV